MKDFTKKLMQEGALSFREKTGKIQIYSPEFAEAIIEATVKECARRADKLIEEEWFDVGPALLEHFGIKDDLKGIKS